MIVMPSSSSRFRKVIEKTFFILSQSSQKLNLKMFLIHLYSRNYRKGHNSPFIQCNKAIIRRIDIFNAISWVVRQAYNQIRTVIFLSQLRCISLGNSCGVDGRVHTDHHGYGLHNSHGNCGPAPFAQVTYHRLQMSHNYRSYLYNFAITCLWWDARQMSCSGWPSSPHLRGTWRVSALKCFSNFLSTSMSFDTWKFCFVFIFCRSESIAAVIDAAAAAASVATGGDTRLLWYHFPPVSFCDFGWGRYGNS